MYRALDTELISVLFVSFMYRICIEEVSKKLYRLLYRFMYRAFSDQYRKLIENYVSSFVSFPYRSCIVCVSYLNKIHMLLPRPTTYRGSRDTKVRSLHAVGRCEHTTEPS